MEMSDSGNKAITVHSDDSNSNSGVGLRRTSRSNSSVQSITNMEEDALAKIETELEIKKLSVNSAKFLDDFDPERSTRELRKMQRKLKPSQSSVTKNSTTLYDETGCIRESGIDICDCLDIDCPGCHFPCPKCGSEKCSTECRCNRKWHFDNIYVEGTKIHIKMPLVFNK